MFSEYLRDCRRAWRTSGYASIWKMWALLIRCPFLFDFHNWPVLWICRQKGGPLSFCLFHVVLINVKTNNRLQDWYYVKDVSRHQTYQYSRIATVDRCFVILKNHQRCVAKICNASPKANAHNLQGDRTLNPLALRNTLCQAHVSEPKDSKCYDWFYQNAAFLKHHAGLVLKCLGWPCPATVRFCFLRHPSWHFVSLRSETHACAPKHVRALCNLCALSLGLALHIFATQWRWVPGRTKQQTNVTILLYRFMSCLVSRNVFHEVSASQSIVCLTIFFGWLDLLLESFTLGGGESSQKNWMGMCVSFPNPLPCLWLKSSIVSILFMTSLKIGKPIYDLTIT